MTPPAASDTRRRRYPFDLDRSIVFDVEVYPARPACACWCVGFGFVHHGQFRTTVEETKEGLVSRLRQFREQGRILIGYNSKRYDVPIVRCILSGGDPYELSRAIIGKDQESTDRFYRSGPERFPCDHIDIGERLRRGQYPMSLKAIAANMGRPRLEELPFDPTFELTDEQWAAVKSYNLVDLEHTWELLTRVGPDLQALAALSDELGQDLRSTPAPQVVERIFIGAFERAYGRSPEQIDPPAAVIYEPVTGVIPPRSKDANDWSIQIVGRPLPVTDRELEVPEADFRVGNLALHAGGGGLHSINEPCVYYADETHDLVQVDVASFYPSLIAKKGIFPDSLGDVGLDRYRAILEERLELKAKARSTTDPAERDRLNVRVNGLKLILNSTYGKFGDPFSVMFDLRAKITVTISGQIMLIDLIERFQDHGVEVLLANTDGLYLRATKGSDALAKVIDAWEADTGMTLEQDGLTRLAVASVNSYAYVDLVGKSKAKGDTFRDRLASCASPSDCTVPNALVIGHAVTQALLRDIPPEQTIRQCRDLLMFTRITRTSSKVEAAVLVDELTGRETPLPKISRWYHAKGSKKRISHLLGGGRQTTPVGAHGIDLAMDLSGGSIPGDLDHGRYIEAARAQIQSMAGYHHRDPGLLDGNPLALEALGAGLCPCPKWKGKAQMRGSKAGEPTFLWDWSGIRTVGTYTGPKTGLLVVDVDNVEKWSKAVGGGKMTFLDGRVQTLAGCLVSCHGDATPDAVRTATTRGKLIFRFAACPDHPIAKMTAGRWLKRYGCDVFFGQGMPSVLGRYISDGGSYEGDDYRLDGVLDDAPEWVVEMLTPPTTKARTARLSGNGPVDPQALYQARDLFAAVEPKLEGVECRVKERNGQDPILVFHCPDHDGDDDDAHIAIGPDGPHIHCKHASCDLLPGLNGKVVPIAPAPPATEPEAEPEVDDAWRTAMQMATPREIPERDQRPSSGGNGSVTGPAPSANGDGEAAGSAGGYICTKGGQPKSCMTNTEIWVRENRPGLEFAYDSFQNDVLLDGAPFTEEKSVAITKAIEDSLGTPWSRDHTWFSLVEIAHRKRYSSLTQYLDSLRWDGVGRLESFFSDHYDVADTPYHREVGRVLFLSAAARGLQPGAKVDTVPLLIGRQGINKSRSIEALCPRAEWFTDNIGELHGGAETAKRLAGKWLIELGELAAMRRSEIEYVKSFISIRSDNYRPSYGRRNQDFMRSCIFIGTTNSNAPLQDTENRRFLPIRVGEANVGAIISVRDQLWAEAVHRTRGGEAWWTTDPTLAAEVGQQGGTARSVDAWEEMLDERINLRERVTVTECAEMLGVKPDQLDKSKQTRIGIALVALGFERKRGQRPLRGWYYERALVPPEVGPK